MLLFQLKIVVPVILHARVVYTKEEMYYYEVAPAYRQLHSAKPLTYHSLKAVGPGKIVVVKIRSTVVVGIVIKRVAKPHFSTQAIIELTYFSLPHPILKLFLWLMDYYPSPIGPLAQLFVPNSLKEISPSSSSPKLKPLNLPPLTSEQEKIIKTIKKSDSNTFLLHGDTATGKSRIYIELTKNILLSSKSALILTPEISLTPQLVESFEQALGMKVLVTHSNLTGLQKHNLWVNIAQSKEPLVVIGPRSALFMPINNLGIIVVDEAHETAYKQEQLPRYQATRVASKLAQLSEATLIFGSATPLASDYYIAQQKKVPILRMTEKPLFRPSSFGPEIKMIDLTNKDEKTSYALLSKSLIDAVKKTLGSKEQSLIFLNRRGSARVILCQNCSWQAHCPRCDLPYTYHSDSHSLRCHTCGRTDKAPSTCPKCSSTDIIFKSPGTKTIAESLSRIFPDAVIARFDKDNLKNEKFEARYQDLRLGKIDIMVGTQLIAKGHDLPRLACVGILIADNELSFPDYSAEERSYQLIKQLIGRVDRGHRKGRVIIQTYNQESTAIKAAIGDIDGKTFYADQLKTRRKYGFPPFAHFMKIEVSRASQKGAERAADKIAAFLRQQPVPIEILGPHPAFIEKRGDKWIWQLIVSSKKREHLAKLSQTLPLNPAYDLDPNNLL